MRQLFSLRAACYFLFAAKIFPNLFALMPMGADRMPHFLWQEVSMKHRLPKHPVTIGSATALGDFVAVVKNQQETEIFFLDHKNLFLGWQKKGFLKNETVSSIQYGLGRFFIFGVDTTNHHSIVSSSSDNGKTWNKHEIQGSSADYDLAAFSLSQGFVTESEGSVAKTDDGITWTQIIPPSHSKRKIFTLHNNANDQLGFVLVEASLKKYDGFFLVDDFSQKKPLISTDGSTWKKSEAMSNSFTAGSGEFLLYQGQGFSYRYPGVQTGSDYSVTLAENTSPHFIATDANNAPQIQIIDVILTHIGQGEGWVYLGKDLKTGSSLIIYSGNRTFFVADLAPTSIDNPVIALSSTQLANSEQEKQKKNGLIAIATDGTAYVASTSIDHF